MNKPFFPHVKGRCSLTLFWILLLIGCRAIKESDDQYFRPYESVEKEKPNVVDCDSLLQNIDRAALKKIAGKFSTTGVTAPRSSYKTSGTFGHYNLLYESGKEVRFLGELFVHTEEEPENWVHFSDKETIIAVSLKEPAFAINELLKVGSKLTDVEKVYHPLDSISNRMFQYDTDCERLILEVDADGRVVHLKIELQ